MGTDKNYQTIKSLIIRYKFGIVVYKQ